MNQSLAFAVMLACAVGGAAGLNGCSKSADSGTSGAESPPAPGSSPNPSGGVVAPIDGGLVHRRVIGLKDVTPAQRVGKGPGNTLWVSNSDGITLIDIATGNVTRTVKWPFSVYQDRDLLGEGRNVAFLRNSDGSSNELAAFDETTLSLRTYQLGTDISASNDLALTRDLTVLAVNTPTSVMFYVKNTAGNAFNVLKAELKFPDGFTDSTIPGSTGTLVSRNSNWAVTPIRRKDLKSAALFLMDLFTRKTSVIFRQDATRPGRLIDAPLVYAFSDDGNYLLAQTDLTSGRLSVLELASNKTVVEVTMKAKENSVLDSISQPRIVGDKIFANVTYFDPDASLRSSQINVFDLKSGALLKELPLEKPANSYTVLSDHQLAAVADESISIFDY